MKKILIVLFMLAIPLFSSSNSEAKANHIGEFHQIIHEYDLKIVENIPHNITPLIVDNPEELITIITQFKSNSQKTFEEFMPVGISDINSSRRLIELPQLSQVINETRTCATHIPTAFGATFTGYVNVTTAPGFLGLGRIYQSIGSMWWSYTGFTAGVGITNVSQNAYLIQNNYMRFDNNFTVDVYTFTPIGAFLVYSYNDYVWCQIPA